MPLRTGSSQETISHNIAEMIRAGHPRAQAEAAAYRSARENKDAGPMRFYTTSDISENRMLTPEGFLLCLNVPIARTGVMLYGDSEVPIDADGAGLVRIAREDDEVFRTETIASFLGKPVTNDHPDDFVNPENWKEHAVGIVLNVRRGDGIEDDLLLGDLLITDKDAIEAVEDGKVEVSSGYDAEYEQTDIGRGRQFNIIGNHVALVDNGRCGKRCSIGDQKGVFTMPNPTIKDLIKNAFKTRDAKGLDKALATLDDDTISNGEGEERSQHIHVHVVGGSEQQKATAGEQQRQVADDEPMTHGTFKKAMDDYFKAKDEAVEKKKAEDAAKEEEERKKAEDEDMSDEADPDAAKEEKEKEKRTADAMKIIKSRAEILSPGFRVPTADCKCKDKKVKDQLLNIRRKVLTESYRSEKGKAAITPFLQGKEATFDKLPAAIIESAFIGASEILRNANNSKANRSTSTNDNNSQTVDAFSKGGMDKINQDFWAKKKGS